jgi:general secretion pathway protein E
MMAGGSYNDLRSGRSALFAQSLGLSIKNSSDDRAIWSASGLSSDEFALRLASYFSLPRGAFDDILASGSMCEGFSHRFLRDAQIYPFLDNGQTFLAVAAPPDEAIIKAVGLVAGLDVRILIVSFDEIGMLLASKLPDDEDAFEESDPALVDQDVESLRDLASGAPIVRLVNDLFERAHVARATDLHIEPMRDRLQIRMRVDGVLRPLAAPSFSMTAAIISRVKIIAGLDIAERRLPQDGAAHVSIRNTKADIRVATIPGAHGESAVIRFLPRDKRLLEAARLGLTPPQEVKFNELLNAPNGMIVIAGPTGSGKTTTLATALTILNDSSRKILTVEDPVEYEISGIVQTQVNPAAGLTFASALRSFLRHDPDVIMVGEIRDAETARIAVQAALTGHLVLTTLHTDTAAAVLPRLVDLGIEPFLLQSTLRAVLGQRLLRNLCEHCRRPVELDEARLAQDVRYAWLGLRAGAMVCEPVGCERCLETGYRGRSAVFEVLEATQALRLEIRRTQDQDEIEAVARREGFRSMLDHAAELCARGQTSPDEALRVLGVR